MTDEEWTCSFCGCEVGGFELGDGRLIGYGCLASALREAETQILEAAFDEHLHLSDLER